MKVKKYLTNLRIDFVEGVLGGLTSPLRSEIWADPPPLENFSQLTHLLRGLGAM